uniref:Uncharacterized protein n=1 Tax=Plectus sambesii TaxID=2011161 RepID=A0A914XDD1_9BILA
MAVSDGRLAVALGALWEPPSPFCPTHTWTNAEAPERNTVLACRQIFARHPPGRSVFGLPSTDYSTAIRSTRFLSVRLISRASRASNVAAARTNVARLVCKKASSKTPLTLRQILHFPSKSVPALPASSTLIPLSARLIETADQDSLHSLDAPIPLASDSGSVPKVRRRSVCSATDASRRDMIIAY